ncbi:MAG TPA: O-antigen ligase family protein [Longimicrobiales bacterium]
MGQGAPALASARHDRLRVVATAAGGSAVCLGASYILANRPWFATGAVAGGALLFLLLLRPKLVLGVLLALGPFDLSFMTGGFKALLPGLGGLDMNGIRLIGVVFGLTAVAVVERDMLRHALGRYGRWYLAFLAFAAGTLVLSPARIEGLRLLFKLAYPFLLFLAVLAVVRSREELERLGDWTLWGAAAIALLVNPIYVLAGGYEVDLAGRVRVHGVGAHENPFSFYLLVVTLIAFARFSVRGQFRYLGLCAVFGVWMVLTLTRITLLASLAGLAGAALYGALIGRNRRAVVAAGVIGGALAVALVPVALERSFGYIPSASELLGYLSDPIALWRSVNWQGRQIIWPVLFKAFLSSPLVGLGLGASTALLIGTFQGGMGAVVHNEYLRLLIDTGVVGSSLYAIAVLQWFGGTLRAGRRDDALVREFAMPAFAAIVAWVIIAATDNPFDYYAPFTQYIGFLCAGALAAAALPSAEAEQGA